MSTYSDNPIIIVSARVSYLIRIPEKIHTASVRRKNSGRQSDQIRDGIAGTAFPAAGHCFVTQKL